MKSPPLPIKPPMPQILVLFTVVAALLVGLLAQPIAAQDLGSAPAPRMVDIDGRDVLVMTAGFEHLDRGQLVVVLESGGGTPLQNWGTVFTDVAVFAPVVAYDRAGIGGSEWDGEPPTPERRVEQLRALLARLNAPPPYVLVGHSWGGALIRVFAGRYPDEVAGLVYVDPTDFSQDDADIRALNEAVGLAEEDRKALNESQREMFAQSPPGLRAEMEVVSEFVAEEVGARGLGPEPAVPLAVLLGAKYTPPPPGIELPFDPQVGFAAMTRQRIEKMSGWAMASPEGLFVMGNHAGHFVHQDDPALLTDAIHRIVFPGIPRQIRETLAAGGDVGEAYRAMALRYPADRLDENLLNRLGYELLQEGRVDDAVAVFELNVEAYPEAANPHDSLGDGYSAAGRLEEARDSYARAVVLAEATGHPSLELYRENLERVTEELGGRPR